LKEGERQKGGAKEDRDAKREELNKRPLWLSSVHENRELFPLAVL